MKLVKKKIKSYAVDVVFFLIVSVFLVSFTDSNKQLPNVKSVSESLDH